MEITLEVLSQDVMDEHLEVFRVQLYAGSDKSPLGEMYLGTLHLNREELKAWKYGKVEFKIEQPKGIRL